MRKLAPVFITVLAFAAGNAVANTTATSPTVSPNTTNPNNMSYSDKSSTSPGTNAAMDDKMKPTATTDEDKALQKTRKKTRKMAAAPVPKQSPTLDGSTTSTNPPTKTTDGAAANSLTGRSTGQ